MEGFVGNGALKRVIPKLIEEGWDDVPTLKFMKSEDMDAINMTQQQKDALEMRTYLHDRALIQYGNKLESSGKCLQELLGLSTDEISSQFGMKRGHIARFIEKGTSNSSIPDPLQQPPQALVLSRKITKTSSNNSIHKATKMDPMLYREAMGDKENQISWSSRLFSWINWSSKPNTENKDNDEDVLHLMPYINDQQQLELQLTSHKNTVLHVAAQFGNQKYVKIILEKGPSSSLLCCLNMDGETPLHIAARKGHLDIVKELIERAKRLGHEEVESGGGAAKEMLRATNKDNDTALHMAARNGHSRVVELLTTEDPEFTHPPNNAEETPLYLAAERAYTNVVSMILKNCKSPAYGGPKGQTALHAAVAYKWRTESSKIFFKLKIDQSAQILLDWNQHLIKETEEHQDLIKKTDECGWTPFHYAACFGNQYGVKLMLEKDKSVAYITTDEEGDEKTALHIAAANGCHRVMEELLSQCPDCWEMVNSEGKNVLHIAVDAQQKKVIEYIFNKSWIIHLINQKDIEGNTPLHLLATDSMLELWHWWKATNNKNLIPQDLLLSWSKEYSLGVARNKISRNQESRKIRKEESNKRKAQVTEKRKVKNEELKKMGDTHMIVATLIATITFAAGCTMPGGYNSNEGSNQGMPLLLREAAFKVFVITNTIAMICSTSSAFIYVTASVYYVKHKDEVSKKMRRYIIALNLILIAVAAMIVAFITGSLAVLAHSLGLVISVYVIGGISFLIYFFELKKLRSFKIQVIRFMPYKWRVAFRQRLIL